MRRRSERCFRFDESRGTAHDPARPIASSHRAGVDSAPPHSPEVQAVLDEQNQGAAPKVARNFRMAYVATVTLRDRIVTAIGFPLAG